MNNLLETASVTTKFIPAPPPTDPAIPPSIYGIEVNADQTVEWEWLKLPDGNRVVTSYKIVKSVL